MVRQGQMALVESWKKRRRSRDSRLDICPAGALMPAVRSGVWLLSDHYTVRVVLVDHPIAHESAGAGVRP